MANPSGKGKPAEGRHSGRSRPPDFVLLNAVAGVDADTETHLLGDGPRDLAADGARQVREFFHPDPVPPKDDVRALFLQGIVPPGVAGRGPEVAGRLLQIVDALLADIDLCYEDDWERPARPAEKRWVYEYLLRSLKPGDDD